MVHYRWRALGGWRSTAGMVMRSPGLVIFDCEGVLVDSEPICSALLARMLTAAGVPTTQGQARREYWGMTLEQVVAQAQARLGRPLPEHWCTIFERERRSALRLRLRPMPGAAAALARILADGWAACATGRGARREVREALRSAGLHEHFAERTLFSAREVRCEGPRPDLPLHAARMLGVAPAGCVVVTATLAGVMAGTSAGMRTLCYAPAGGAGEAALRTAGAEPLRCLELLPGLLGQPGEA